MSNIREVTYKSRTTVRIDMDTVSVLKVITDIEYAQPVEVHDDLAFPIQDPVQRKAILAVAKSAPWVEQELYGSDDNESGEYLS